MNRHCFSWSRRILVAGCVIVASSIISVYAGQAIYAGLWHITHRKPVTCGAFTIPVPDGWWAMDTGCILVTPSPSYGFKDKKAVQIIFNVMSTPSVQDNAWRDAVLQRLVREGHPAREVTDLTVAGNETVCFEHDATGSTKSVISCDVDKRMEVNFFFDDPTWVPRFYKLLGTIRS